MYSLGWVPQTAPSPPTATPSGPRSAPQLSYLYINYFIVTLATKPSYKMKQLNFVWICLFMIIYLILPHCNLHIILSVLSSYSLSTFYGDLTTVLSRSAFSSSFLTWEKYCHVKMLVNGLFLLYQTILHHTPVSNLNHTSMNEIARNVQDSFFEIKVTTACSRIYFSSQLFYII